jgi:transcription antitermination protein NusB
LLFAVWEFKNTETDARIIINEAIELAKCFAEEDAYRFVNGILDPVSKEFPRETPIEN